MKQKFPIFKNKSSTYCYLDSAATTHKPKVVLDAVDRYHNEHNSNIHRSSYFDSRISTAAFENTRENVKSFINSSKVEEIIFTSGTTASINSLAFGLQDKFKENDLILIDITVHHSNLVPWQQLKNKIGLNILPIPLDLSKNGLDLDKYEQLLKLKPKLVILNHVSNVTGILNPIEHMIKLAQEYNSITVVDGAQAVAHIEVDVTNINCDFYVFSAHKMYGPTGVGVLYGKFHLLDQLTPMLTGGEMVQTVSFNESTFQQLPYRLEAGTPNISGIIGLNEAINFLNNIDRKHQLKKEKILLEKIYNSITSLGGICYSFSPSNIANIAFNIPNIHHLDIAMLLDQLGVAIRVGAHCASPLLIELGINGCCRVSLGVYNDESDIDYFLQKLEEVINLC